MALTLDDPEAWQDLHGFFAPLREAAPLLVGADGSVVVLRHAEVGAVLKDRAFGATDLLAIYGLDHGPVWDWWHQVMSSRNPPDHTRVRGTVSRAFTPRAVDALRPRIRQIATELLDSPAMMGDGPIDVIDAFANELPSRVMAYLLGIPTEDRATFSAWTSDIGLIFGAAASKDAVLLTHIEQVLAQLYDYVERLSAQRRAEPGDDLLSLLISAEGTSDRLDGDELAALVVNLLFAGHDTTRSQLMIAFYLLATYPDQFDDLHRNPSLALNATEEMLRFEPAVFGAARQPFDDVVIGDVRIAAGTPVQVALVAASAIHGPMQRRTALTFAARSPVRWTSVGASTTAWVPRWLGPNCPRRCHSLRRDSALCRWERHHAGCRMQLFVGLTNFSCILFTPSPSHSLWEWLNRNVISVN